MKDLNVSAKEKADEIENKVSEFAHTGRGSYCKIIKIDLKKRLMQVWKLTEKKTIKKKFDYQ